MTNTDACTWISTEAYQHAFPENDALVNKSEARRVEAGAYQCSKNRVSAVALNAKIILSLILKLE